MSRVFLWRDLYDRFKLLADDQQRMPEERRLRVYCDYTDHSSGKGAFSFFHIKPEFGKWAFSKAPDHVFWKKFEAVATLAGDKLGAPKNMAPPSSLAAIAGNVSGSVYWLHRLYDYLLKNASPEVSAADDRRGVIKNVCQASAAFCAHLADEEVVISRHAPDLDRSELTANKEPPRAQNSEKTAQPVKNESRVTTVSDERKSFVQPILEKKGWSTHQLAVEAELDFHTTNDYLEGKTKPNRSTRKQLAEALGIAVDKLPK